MSYIYSFVLNLIKGGNNDVKKTKIKRIHPVNYRETSLLYQNLHIFMFRSLVSLQFFLFSSIVLLFFSAMKFR